MRPIGGRILYMKFRLQQFLPPYLLFFASETKVLRWFQLQKSKIWSRRCQLIGTRRPRQYLPRKMHCKFCPDARPLMICFHRSVLISAALGCAVSAFSIYSTKRRSLLTGSLRESTAVSSTVSYWQVHLPSWGSLDRLKCPILCSFRFRELCDVLSCAMEGKVV